MRYFEKNFSVTAFLDEDKFNLLTEFHRDVVPHFPEPIPRRGISGLESSLIPRIMTDQEIIDQYFGSLDGALRMACTLDQLWELIQTDRITKGGYGHRMYIQVGGQLRTFVIFGHGAAGGPLRIRSWPLGTMGCLPNFQLFWNLVPALASA